MKKNEIAVNRLYLAKVSHKITVVRVDCIRTATGTGLRRESRIYDVTNLKTGRSTSFRSAAKFRQEVTKDQADEMLRKVSERTEP